MQEGLIIKNISNQYLVQSNNRIYVCNARGKFKKEEELTPVVGDKVKIQIEQEETKMAIIQEILPRSNYIKRPKLANISQLVFVLSTKMPKPDLLMLDKQLAFAEYLGIKSIIVMNKVDLELAEQITKVYKEIGYTVVSTIAKQKQGIGELEEQLKHEINAFSGNSGVGKSTLLNAIFKKDLTEEGAISQKNKKGKNTTTAISLYELGQDTYIADTPGFSTFEIYEIETKELCFYFKEFKPYIKQCEFVGCTHIKEQQCGIKEALAQGKIAQTRYDNYIKIYQDLKDKEEHKW